MSELKDKLKTVIKQAQHAKDREGLFELINKILAKLPEPLRTPANTAAADTLVKSMQIMKGFGAKGVGNLKAITPIELMNMLKASAMDKKIDGTMKAAPGNPKLNKALDEALERNQFEDAIRRGEAKIRVVPKRK